VSTDPNTPKHEPEPGTSTRNRADRAEPGVTIDLRGAQLATKK